MLYASLFLPMTFDPASSRDTPPTPRGAADVRPLVRAIVAKTLKEPPSHPDVEDATQEAVRRLLEAPDPTPALAVTIARNVAVDVLRARVRDRARTEAPDGAELQVRDPAPLADDRLASKQRARATASALSSLPTEQRDALLLHVTEELSYADIGARMNAPIGTVASWILRARQNISRALGANEKEPT